MIKPLPHDPLPIDRQQGWTPHDDEVRVTSVEIIVDYLTTVTDQDAENLFRDLCRGIPPIKRAVLLAVANEELKP